MPSDATLTVLEKLIGFPTVSSDSNLDLLAFVQEWLAGHGVASRLVHDATGAKANLFATVGPPGDNGIILSGHVDVVPTVGQAWSRDPFKLHRDGGRLYGRGTTDMKGFDSVILGLVPEMVQAGLKRPIHLALSYDEEVGCIGVRTLLDALRAEGFRAGGCIVGEPSGLDVIIAHKGKRAYAVTARGVECHSALAPQGVNAVEYAARLIQKISDIGRRLAVDGLRDPAFAVPHTTAHVGTCHGGTALNIVPNRCELIFEFRHLPEDDVHALSAEVQDFADSLTAEMQTVDRASGFAFEEMTAVDGLAIAPDDPFVGYVQRLAGRGAGGKVDFGTEAGLFQQRLGVPTVVCGPGDIAQAHKPDEFIEAAELDAYEGFIRRLVDDCRQERAVAA